MEVGQQSQSYTKLHWNCSGFGYEQEAAQKNKAAEVRKTPALTQLWTLAQ